MPTPKNAESHGSSGSNPRVYTPTNTHIYTTINKNLPTTPMQFFIPQIHDQIHQNIHLQIQQKHDPHLSDHTLTEDEFSVLTKSLSFVPTPSRPFQHKMNISWNKFKTRMLKQYFFPNSIHDKPPGFKRKSNWIPPPSDNLTLVNFLTRSEQELTSINTPCKKTYSNLTVQEKTVLNNLKNNQSIVIKPCDKSGDICIMNTRDYLTKIHTYLQDYTKYKPLTHNPTNAIAKDACTLIDYLSSQHITDKATMELLLLPKDTRTTLFYGLPKIHKPDCILLPFWV